MSDRTPADTPEPWQVLARELRRAGLAYDLSIEDAHDCLDALAAAGYRVVPISDDNTRAEVLDLVNRAKDRRTAHSVKKRYAIADDFDHVDLSRLERMADLLAAAYLDGQPQDRPEQCPECGSDDPDYCNTDGERHRLSEAISYSCCCDSWHVGGSGDTR